jgi:hypothetical protein
MKPDGFLMTDGKRSNLTDDFIHFGLLVKKNQFNVLKLSLINRKSFQHWIKTMPIKLRGKSLVRWVVLWLANGPFTHFPVLSNVDYVII